MEKYSISLIGSGNVAWHFAHALYKTGHNLLEIYSRNEDTSREIINHIPGLSFKKDLDFSEGGTQVVLLAIPDKAIKEVLSEIVVRPEVIILGLSGSLNLPHLKTFHSKVGILYPLQTFTKNRTIDFSEIPFFLESDLEGVELVLINLSSSLSKHFYFFNAEQRKTLHIAAVFASNFTNFMFTISKDILDKEGIKLDLLKPLIGETLKKAFQSEPEKAQTGPARRCDVETIENHLNSLDYNENFKEIYEIISKQIIKRYH